MEGVGQNVAVDGEGEETTFIQSKHVKAYEVNHQTHQLWKRRANSEAEKKWTKCVLGGVVRYIYKVQQWQMFYYR